MSRTRKTAIAAVITVSALGVGGYELWGNRLAHPASTPEKSLDSEAPPQDPQPSSEQAEAQPDESAPLAPSPPQEEAEQAFPPAEDLSETDISSESLAGFAHRLTELMESAMNSEKEALPAFTQLEQCVRDSEHQEMVQARLICFANASKLSSEYPALLGTRFAELAQTNPKLVGMLQTTDLE